jgi:metal-responsive CopG/Arc/MetJ family transcriptional regulator
MSARVEVRLPDQSIAQLDEMCSHEEISRAETIRKALAVYAKVIHETSKGQSLYVGTMPDPQDIPDDINIQVKELTFIG